LKGAFQKISRVGSLTGATRWYLSKDCLLAAKRMMYVVEYRRFYLRDLESIVVWPSRLWLWRLIVPGILLTAVGACLWQWVNSTAGAIFTGIGFAWVVLELTLGPTAVSRVRATGVSLDLPLVKRTRRARKVLNAIDAAVRDSRDVTMQPVVPIPSLQPDGVSVQTNSEAASAVPSIADASQTDGF
jgi:hypothetical protein